MAKTSNQRGRKNNNPEGHNQYDSSWKDRPVATAAAAAAAVGAGVFLWSRRNQISDQISNLSNQVTDWAGNMQGSGKSDYEMADSGLQSESSASTGSTGRSAAKTGRKQGLASGSNSGSAFEATGV